MTDCGSISPMSQVVNLSMLMFTAKQCIVVILWLPTPTILVTNSHIVALWCHRKNGHVQKNISFTQILIELRYNWYWRRSCVVANHVINERFCIIWMCMIYSCKFIKFIVLYILYIITQDLIENRLAEFAILYKYIEMHKWINIFDKIVLTKRYIFCNYHRLTMVMVTWTPHFSWWWKYGYI